MPKNVELIADIVEVAEGLGLDVETHGLTNAELSDLLSDLKAKQKDQENETAADEAEDLVTQEAVKKAKNRKAGDPVAQAAKAKDQARSAVKSAQDKVIPPYYVAPRCALTTKRGILSGDTADEVREEDLVGGAEAMKAFLKSGHILKSE